jgi:hypothetical protein
VFQAFSRIIREAGRKFVVMDTAPTGHTLLLLDATGAYHREVSRQLSGSGIGYTTPMMQLQDPADQGPDRDPAGDHAGAGGGAPAGRPAARRDRALGLDRQSKPGGCERPLSAALLSCPSGGASDRRGGTRMRNAPRGGSNATGGAYGHPALAGAGESRAIRVRGCDRWLGTLTPCAEQWCRGPTTPNDRARSKQNVSRCSPPYDYVDPASCCAACAAIPTAATR